MLSCYIREVKKALVLGAGGFIGSHLVSKLKAEGYFVRGVDLKFPEFSQTSADEFFLSDLRDYQKVNSALHLEDSGGVFEEIYQLAADMGGAGYVFTGAHDADIMHNSATINLNVLDVLRKNNQILQINKTKIFYSSSACMYPEYNQLDPANPNCEESSAYPANPDSEYGWEKLFSERLYQAFNRNYGISVAIARYHNIYGPEGTWDGGREKAPAAICRKISKLPSTGGEIEVWGDGLQTRSFLFVDECIEATRRLMKSDFSNPINIGSEEMVTINNLTALVSTISGKAVTLKHKLDAPTGVRGRNSSNALIRATLGWDYSLSLEEGLVSTYKWINQQVNNLATHSD
jgi:nucleoside-diphosphate-sugar epimerase